MRTAEEILKEIVKNTQHDSGYDMTIEAMHMYALHVAEAVKKKCLEKVLIECSTAFDPSCSKIWHVTPKTGEPAKFIINKGSILDIDILKFIK